MLAKFCSLYCLDNKDLQRFQIEINFNLDCKCQNIQRIVNIVVNHSIEAIDTVKFTLFEHKNTVFYEL